MNRDNPFPDGDESAAAHPDIRDIIGGEDPPPGASGIVDDGGGDADPLAGAFRTDGLIAPEPGTVPAADDGRSFHSPPTRTRASLRPNRATPTRPTAAASMVPTKAESSGGRELWTLHRSGRTMTFGER